jgi:hypothetical protein
MILPNKYTREEDALIGIGAILLNELSSAMFLSTLWEKAKVHNNIGNFEQFILGLDLLFMMGLVNIKNNEISREA